MAHLSVIWGPTGLLERESYVGTTRPIDAHTSVCVYTARSNKKGAGVP